MQIETERDLRIKQLRLIVFVMLAIFIVMSVYMIYWLIDYNKHYGFFTKTKAEVVDQKVIEGITFDVLSYKIDDIEYKVTSDVKSHNDIGDIITIYYDKENPLGIIYSLDNRRIILPVITGCFGGVSIALVITYIAIDRANKLSKIGAVQKNKKSNTKNK